MSAPVRITLLGTGNPTPRLRRAGSSVLTRVGDAGIVFDLGPGSAHKLWAAGIDAATVGQVFFTHHHFDHNADYGHFVLSRWDQSAGRGDELQVFGPVPTARITQQLFAQDGVYGPDLEARTQHALSQRMHQLRSGTLPRCKPSIRGRDLAAGERVAGDGWTVTAGAAEHVQPYLASLAYRLDVGLRAVVISGDSRPIAAMVALARGADVLIHMAMDLEPIFGAGRRSTRRAPVRLARGGSRPRRAYGGSCWCTWASGWTTPPARRAWPPRRDRCSPAR